jgi:hypothetical protein
MIPSDIPVPLKDAHHADSGISLKLKFSLASEATSTDEPMQGVDASIGRMDGAISFVAVPGYTNTTNSVTSAAQAAYETAQSFGSSIAPLGQALQSLQQIVNVVDGFADVG